MTKGLNEAAITAARYGGGRNVAAYASAVAVAFSGYSLFETSIRQPELKLFIPPVVQYSSPYQNSNFEVLAIPITVVNQGARTGTALAFELTVENADRSASKRFYSADFGNWSMDKARTFAFKPFAPISLPGRSSQSEVVLFYPRREEKVQQIINEVGSYHLTVTLAAAEVADLGLLDKWLNRPPKPVTLDVEFPVLDHRAFTNGTLPMYQKDYQTTVLGK
jgi:hypothetical protein